MTRKEISYLLKRYKYIVKAIEKGHQKVEITISGRKENIDINDKVLTFIDIFKLIYDKENDLVLKKMIKLNVVYGKSDVNIVSQYPVERSYYYRFKSAFIDKIYHCCILNNLVSLEEILSEKII